MLPETAAIDAEAQRSAACCDLVRSVARSHGEVRLMVTGSSMLPAVWPGDEITVTRCEYTELRAGQIVLYSRNAGLAAHRIERITRDYLVARGDSLLSADPPVLPGEIVGRVESILRHGSGIRPEPSSVGRIASPILRHSDLSRRIALSLARCMSRRHGWFLRRSEEMQAS